MHSLFLSATLMFSGGYGCYGGYGAHGGPMMASAPMPARAVISANGELRIRETIPNYKVEKEATTQPKDGKAEAFKYAVSSTSHSQTLLPAKFVQAFSADGKKIEAARLAQLLKQETVVLVCDGMELVDPDYLKLLKEGTVILVLPPGVGGGPVYHGGKVPAPAPVAKPLPPGAEPIKPPPPKVQ